MSTPRGTSADVKRVTLETRANSIRRNSVKVKLLYFLLYSETDWCFDFILCTSFNVYSESFPNFNFKEAVRSTLCTLVIGGGCFFLANILSRKIQLLLVTAPDF